ncbi:MAG: glycosyltransferase family 9 protein [Candidatus Schekmanbacteria bacterium]|nr:glycosyltransferase family 9 protein [Candidatus Schekmanbacteria bacterium]
MIDKNKIKNIYIRESNWVGDAVMTLPSLRAIRRHFKNAKITIGAKSTITLLLGSSGFADDFVQIPHPVENGKKLKKWKTVFAERKRKYDYGILFTNSFESALELKLMGIPVRAGYDTDGRGFLLNETVSASDKIKSLHEVDYFINLTQSLGIPVEDKTVSLTLSDNDIKFADDFFSSNGLNGKLVIILHPGTSTFQRSWHSERYSTLCNNLIDKYGASVLIIGAPEDSRTAYDIASGIKSPVIDTTGKFNICQSSALIKKAGLFIGNDSGPMHIAASLNTPVVIIFGPGNPEKTKPYTSAELYIQVKREYPCRPCRQRFFEECKPASSGRPECIESITVEDVMEACDTMINKMSESIKGRK